MQSIRQSKPSPPFVFQEELQPPHFSPSSFLTQETDGEKKHSCLDLVERGHQVEYFLHSDSNKPKIPSLACAATYALIRESS